jgi:hypothetical protein
MTARGIASCAASRGSCTSTTPPASLTARAPSAPSEPPPESTTAKPSPWRSASERKNTSIDARRSRKSWNLAAAMVLCVISSLRSGAIT